MMPEAWASIRSMARWVLPVFVGPRTALTRGAKPKSEPGMARCLGVVLRNASASGVRTARFPLRRRIETRLISTHIAAQHGGLAMNDAVAEKHDFGAEVGRLLDLVVHSLYSEREIFLRELVANAADAMDRRRFESLTDAT